MSFKGDRPRRSTDKPEPEKPEEPEELRPELRPEPEELWEAYSGALGSGANPAQLALLLLGVLWTYSLRTEDHPRIF